MIPRSVTGLTGLLSLLTPKGGGPTPPPAPVSCVFPFSFPVGALLPTAKQYPAPGDGQTVALILPDHSLTQNIEFEAVANSNIDMTTPVSGIPIPGNFAVQINVASNMPAAGGLDFLELYAVANFFSPLLSGAYAIAIEDARGNGGGSGNGTVTLSISVAGGPGNAVPIVVSISQDTSYSAALYFVQTGPSSFNVGMTFNGADQGFVQDTDGGNFVIDLGAIGAANEIGFLNQVGPARYSSGNDPAYSNTGISLSWEFNASEITEPLPSGFSFTDLCGNLI